MKSVLSQTYPDIEYIVVDGGSTDGSREIINSYRDRIAKVIFKDDNGIYEGLNNGIREATGDVIALCHSDDQLYDINVVEKIVNEFKKIGFNYVSMDLQGYRTGAMNEALKLTTLNNKVVWVDICTVEVLQSSVIICMEELLVCKRSDLLIDPVEKSLIPLSYSWSDGIYIT